MPGDTVMNDGSDLRALQDRAGERIAADEGWQARSNADATTTGIFLDHMLARTDAVIEARFTAQTIGTPSRSPNERADKLACDARLLLRDLCEGWAGDAFAPPSLHHHAGTVLFPEVSDLDDWLSALNTRMQLTGP